MKIIVNFVKRILSKERVKPMGRWNNDYCDVKTNKKIDLSNEDHCGPCGNQVIKESILKISNSTSNNNNKK